jgi:hypothetical protein
MQPTVTRKTTPWIRGCLSGLILGLVLALIAIVAWFVIRYPALKPTPPPTLTFTPIPPTGTITPTRVPPTITPTPGAPTATPTTLAEGQVVQARQLIEGGEADKVEGMLLPLLDNLEVPAELPRVYETLAQAESAMGHYLLAAAYYEKLYFYEPTAWHVYLLASAYDAGGQFELALEKYQVLVNWQGPEADDYRIFAGQRAAWLSELIKKTTSTPTKR